MLLATLLVLAAAPSTAVVVTRRTQLSVAEAQSLAERVSRSLKDAGVQVALEPAEVNRRLASLGVKDTASCQGRTQCVLEFGRQLGVDTVVSLSVSQFEGERSLALDAYSVASGEVAHRASILFTGTPPPADLDTFAARLKAALSLQAQPPPSVPPPPQPDAPVAAVLVPAEPTAAELVTFPPAERSHTGAIVVGSVGAGALVAAGVLGLTGLLAKSSLDTATGNKSPLTGSEARATADRANTMFAAAGIACLAGVALGATAVALW